jgi:hypothetical protein
MQFKTIARPLAALALTAISFATLAQGAAHASSTYMHSCLVDDETRDYVVRVTGFNHTTLQTCLDTVKSDPYGLAHVSAPSPGSTDDDVPPPPNVFYVCMASSGDGYDQVNVSVFARLRLFAQRAIAECNARAQNGYTVQWGKDYAPIGGGN